MDFPNEMIDHIFHFFQLRFFDCWSIEENLYISLKLQARDLVGISLVCSQFYSLMKKYMEDYHIALYLSNHYYKYDDCYNYCKKGPGLLIDALFAGCRLPFAYSSKEEYNSTVWKDIHTIVELFPKSIHYDSGQLRCRYEVTPLMAACINRNIPMDIIELVLANGADQNKKILLNNYPISILEDLKDNVSDSRWKQIQELFEKYK